MSNLKLIPIRANEIIQDEMLGFITGGGAPGSGSGCGTNDCNINHGSCSGVNRCHVNYGTCGDNSCQSNGSSSGGGGSEGGGGPKPGQTGCPTDNGGAN